MKKRFLTGIACLLALLLAALSPLTVFAKAAEDTSDGGKYISEIRIGMGKDEATAAAALAGYSILSENGNNVDLNQSAGGGWGSKGEKVVYLGYKTTDDISEAVTDLALMNMKGGYSVEDYDILFEQYVSEQVTPLLDRLTDALVEYRVNFSSENESNRCRAAYVHNALNKLIDDDTEKGLGDLLLNRTKYEMGDEAYEALSDAQKKNTTDIVTILCQANGKATLLIENLLARAADTSDDTWLDRFASTTYEDLINELCDEKGMFPTDAEIELIRLYDDDAKKLRAMWNDLYAVLSGYDDYVELVENFDEEAAQSRAEELTAIIDSYKEGKISFEEMMEATKELLDIQAEMAEVIEAIKAISIHDYLSEIEYGDGTLLDFFLRKADTVDASELYPLAASFSDGQKAGLDFISLIELMIIALTDGENYSDEDIDKLEPASVYEGVDRGIYEKCAVGLTSDAMRARAMEEAAMGKDSASLSTTTSILAFVGLSGFTVSGLGWIINAKALRDLNDELKTIKDEIKDLEAIENWTEEQRTSYNDLIDDKAHDELAQVRAGYYNSMFRAMTIGFGIFTIILIGLTVYLRYTELKEHYNVEFTPIPRYMVDERDITAYNAKGERIFIKNQTAYYKAVECNRTESDEMYGSIETYADLNGDVGKQWLALYAVKQEPAAPILAGSLKAVVDNDDLPAEYTTGIHMFGSASAFNLNSNMYVWNGEAPSVYVYYKVDSAAKRSAAGSLFAGSSFALAGGIGFAVGALAAVLIMSARKKKEEKTVA